MYMNMRPFLQDQHRSAEVYVPAVIFKARHVVGSGARFFEEEESLESRAGCKKCGDGGVPVYLSVTVCFVRLAFDVAVRRS